MEKVNGVGWRRLKAVGEERVAETGCCSCRFEFELPSSLVPVVESMFLLLLPMLLLLLLLLFLLAFISISWGGTLIKSLTCQIKLELLQINHLYHATDESKQEDCPG